MNLLAVPELKVGLLVLVVAGLIAFMSIQVTEDPSTWGRTYDAWFVTTDASGLVKNSAVRMAGIPIGVIRDIRLQGGQARVDLVIRRDVEIYTSAAVELRTQGILGDKHVEVFPGNPQDPRLPNGGQIETVRDSGSLDNVVQDIGQVTGSLGDVAEALRRAVLNEGDTEHLLGRILFNIERMSADLSEITSSNKVQIREIVDQVHGITATLDELVNDPSDEGFRESWRRAVASLDRVDIAMQNIEEITEKVNRGDGTIGRLLNDQDTADELHAAIEGVSNLLGTTSRLETSLEFYSDYITGDVGAARSNVGIRIQPGLDRYYVLQVVDDPAGYVEVRDRSITSDDGTVDSTERTTYQNRLKFTALFAKNFYDLTVKGGMIENAGGFGIDYHFFRRRLTASLEAFDFSQLHLRGTLQWQLIEGVQLRAGMNDALNNRQSAGGFIGAGILLTNDDLMLLVSRLPF